MYVIPGLSAMGCTPLPFGESVKPRTAQGLEPDFLLKKPVAELTQTGRGFAVAGQGGAQ